MECSSPTTGSTGRSRSRPMGGFRCCTRSCDGSRDPTSKWSWNRNDSRRRNPMSAQAKVREHVLDLLGGGHAHLDFEKAIAGLPAALRGARPPGLPHTPWRLLEHMRLAQWDIL